MRRSQLKTGQGLLPQSQGLNLALAVLHVPYSLDSGHQTGTGYEAHAWVRNLIHPKTYLFDSGRQMARGHERHLKGERLKTF